MGFLKSWQPQLLSVLRIMSGLLFWSTAAPNCFIFHIAMFDGKLMPIVMAAGVIELAGGALVTIGRP